MQTLPAGAECVICLEGSSTAGNPLRRDCACRGSAGWAHTACLIQAAKQKTDSWYTCPTCKQHWTRRTRLELAEAHYNMTVAGEVVGDNLERIKALKTRAVKSFSCRQLSFSV